MTAAESLKAAQQNLAAQKETVAARGLVSDQKKQIRKDGIRAGLAGGTVPANLPTLAEIDDFDTGTECLIEDTPALEVAVKVAERAVAAEAVAKQQAEHDGLLSDHDAELAKINSAFEALRAPLARAAALYQLAHSTFPHPDRPRKTFFNAIDAYGPAGRLAEYLRAHDWSDDLRPTWAMKHPSTEQRREPIDGTFATIDELRAEIQA